MGITWEHSWTLALIGGSLIGLSATMVLLFVGRVCGISGIYGGLILRKADDCDWRFSFFLGLLVAGLAARFFAPELMENLSGRPWPTLLVGGLLVGYGTSLGSGCTSGHGVCGISRLSPRSIVATIAFMAAGMATVAIWNWLSQGVVR